MRSSFNSTLDLQNELIIHKLLQNYSDMPSLCFDIEGISKFLNNIELFKVAGPEKTSVPDW